MIVVKTNILTAEEINEINNLQEIAFKDDGLENYAFLSNEINFNKDLPCFYIGYEDGKIVSFLTTFMPTNCEAEVIAVTHPNYRRRGFFKELFNAAKETLLGAGINKVLLLIEAKSNSGFNVLKIFNSVKWGRSEYRMSFNEENYNNKDFKLDFIKVNNENKKAFKEITKEAFPNLEENGEFVNTIIKSDNRIGYIGFKNDESVGVFDLNYEDNDTFLYGVGVTNKYRGKGYGKDIVSYAIYEGLKHSNKIVLDVDSDNPTAFNLYKKSGFKIDFQVDYYIYELV